MLGIGENDLQRALFRRVAERVVGFNCDPVSRPRASHFLTRAGDRILIGVYVDRKRLMK